MNFEEKKIILSAILPLVITFLCTKGEFGQKAYFWSFQICTNVRFEGHFGQIFPILCLDK